MNIWLAIGIMLALSVWALSMTLIALAQRYFHKTDLIYVVMKLLPDFDEQKLEKMAPNRLFTLLFVLLQEDAPDLKEPARK